MNIYKDYEEQTHAVLLFGYKFEWDHLKNGAESLDALLDAVPGFKLVACCDLESTEEEFLQYTPFLYGIEIFTAFGYEEQMTGLTWEELSSHMGAAAEKVEAQLSKIQEHIEGGELGYTSDAPVGWLMGGSSKVPGIPASTGTL